jgi:peptidoglycan/xylan/chitin deacetylase (PgdA/CDA1 family)
MSTIIQTDLFPGAKRKAVTLSYDDGVIHDRRLVEILNRHGLKGSFHLNSATLGKEGRLTPGEIASLYTGHEISAHSATHPHLDALPTEQLAREILEDRRALEVLAGYPVRGMSYPYGTYTDEVVRRLPAFGIEYSRTVESHGRFHVPPDPLRWHPTCHHKADLLNKAEEFIRLTPRRLALLYVWGHSYEFENDGNWDLIEQFASRMAAEAESIWFATNIDVLDYLQALQRLRLGVDGTPAQNLSHRPIWISVNGSPREIAPGETVALA